MALVIEKTVLVPVIYHLACECGHKGVDFVGWTIDDRALHECYKCKHRQVLKQKYPYRTEEPAVVHGLVKEK